MYKVNSLTIHSYLGDYNVHITKSNNGGSPVLASSLPSEELSGVLCEKGKTMKLLKKLFKTIVCQIFQNFFMKRKITI